MQRMSELEGARGFLAIWVMIVHLIPAIGVDPSTFGMFTPLFSGGIRVKIFCAMSGFVIFVMLDRKPETYGPYITKRFLRLFPAYLVVLAVSVLMVEVSIAALENNPFNGSFNLKRLGIFRESVANAPEHILAHLTMLHSLVPASILPTASYAFVGQAWNLTYEWVFYLCAPLLFWISTKNRKLAIGGALLYVSAHFLSRSFVKLPISAQYVSWFMFGILSFYVWEKVKHQGLRHAWLYALGAAVLGYAFTGELAASVWALIFVSILGSLRPGSDGNGLCRFLKSRPLISLGKISYSIYLTHMIPLYLTMYLLNQGNFSHTEYAVILMSTTMIATLGISALLYKYVEQPAIEFGKHLVAARKPAMLAAKAP